MHIVIFLCGTVMCIYVDTYVVEVTPLVAAFDGSLLETHTYKLTQNLFNGSLREMFLSTAQSWHLGT